MSLHAPSKSDSAITRPLKMNLSDPTVYYSVVGTMVVFAVAAFFALHRVTAGYGMMYNRHWGPTLGNRTGWMLMEAPSFILMLLLWLLSPRAAEPALVVMATLFELHYFQRSFIFPLLIRGRSRMPLTIILMGIVFNVVNSYMIGGWLFYVSPPEAYPASWLASPLFIAGTLLFFAGMAINLSSDNIVRHLRRPGAGVRHMDLRQPRAEGAEHPPPLSGGIRRRIRLAAPAIHNTFHLLRAPGPALNDMKLFTQ